MDSIMNLDEAVRKFKDYCQGKGDFDELDFKEYILDDLFRRYSQEEYKRGYIDGGIKAFNDFKNEELYSNE